LRRSARENLKSSNRYFYPTAAYADRGRNFSSAKFLWFRWREITMTYETAVKKAWQGLGNLADDSQYAVNLLGDTYTVNLNDQTVFSNSCNVPAKEYLTLLILHYLIGSLKGNYIPSDEWVSFKEIEGGEIYYPAYRNSVIKPLLRKYGEHPENILAALERFKGRKVDISDAAIEIETFPEVKVRIVLWKADEEFGPEASILYDKNLSAIYTMEDITVFSHFIVGNL
jgi:hypothetical protein